jgi:hypothetical protein
MGASPITTPEQAQQILDLSLTQFNTIRSYFGINDNPFQTDKTYIVYDAVAGANTLHIATGGSSSYSIAKGDGTLPASFTDTGGSKTLNYANDGRYLITIDGDFNGLTVTGEQSTYIAIIAGSNYPLTISSSAFLNCINLETAIFLTSTTVSQNSFRGCSSLKYVDIPNITNIGISGFENCTSLMLINLYGTTSIGNLAFSGCNSLKNISGNSVTSIGNGGFVNCTLLESAQFPSLTSITAGFQGCTSLNYVSMPIITTITGGCFLNCSSLYNVDISSVTSLTGNAFKDCVMLDNVYLPNITNIGVLAFEGCTSLQTIKILYTSGLTVDLNSFQNVDLTDLYVIGAGSLANAQSVETKLLAEGMNQLTGYRLLY